MIGPWCSWRGCVLGAAAAVGGRVLVVVVLLLLWAEEGLWVVRGAAGGAVEVFVVVSVAIGSWRCGVWMRSWF